VKDMQALLPVKPLNLSPEPRATIDDLRVKLLIVGIAAVMGWMCFLWLLVLVSKHRDADLRRLESLSPVQTQTGSLSNGIARVCARGRDRG
jgi:hypothetical protein